MSLRRPHALKQPILVGSVEEQAAAQFIYLDFGKAFNTLQHRRHCTSPCGQDEEISTGWVDNKVGEKLTGPSGSKGSDQ